MISFYEEFVMRAALIPPMLALIGKSKTLWMTALSFGAMHFPGTRSLA